jgi:hypothetical protein
LIGLLGPVGLGATLAPAAGYSARMSSRLVAVALAFVCAAALTAAAAVSAPAIALGGIPSSAPTVAATPAAATLAGHVELCVGEAPGGCLVQNISYCRDGEGCLTSREVAVVDVHGRRLASTRVHHGRFRVTLAPGRDTVELLGDGPHVHERVMQTRNVFVPAGQTTKVEFLFAVP